MRNCWQARKNNKLNDQLFSNWTNSFLLTFFENKKVQSLAQNETILILPSSKYGGIRKVYFEVSRKKNLLGIVYNMVVVERFYFIFV